MDELGELLLRCFTFDVWVFSQWWLYPLLVPAIAYLLFFFVKWAVLTAPVWLPLAIVAQSIEVRLKVSRKRKQRGNDGQEHENAAAG